MKKYFIAGGAGFIGSHLVKTLLQDETDAQVTIFDNFSSGQRRHLDEIIKEPRLNIVRGDIKEIGQLQQAMAGTDIVYHFASNPDIAAAIEKPDIDFWEGTYLTNNVIEAMRRNRVKRLLYASGSGIYGDTETQEIDEDYAPLLPISTYGASKLACEALICSYCHMFDLQATVFRFANVVGPNQTHGVGYDFIRKLTKNPEFLDILGDGSQSKSYIYIDDVISAIRLLDKKAVAGFTYYNVATMDAITVTEIAEMVVKMMNLSGTKYRYTGGGRGWKGDVPVVRLNSQKIRELGWTNQLVSKAAMEKSVAAMIADVKQNRIARPRDLS